MPANLGEAGSINQSHLTDSAADRHTHITVAENEFRNQIADSVMSRLDAILTDFGITDLTDDPSIAQVDIRTDDVPLLRVLANVANDEERGSVCRMLTRSASYRALLADVLNEEALAFDEESPDCTFDEFCVEYRREMLEICEGSEKPVLEKILKSLPQHNLPGGPAVDLPVLKAAMNGSADRFTTEYVAGYIRTYSRWRASYEQEVQGRRSQES